MTLQLPAELWELVDEGLWPMDDRACQLQNLHPLIPHEIIRKFAPNEETIVFFPYPFRTVEEDKKSNKYWEDERNALGEIDPSLSVLIGDFGLGSYADIILDYRTAPPRLLRLQWGKDENHWVDFGLSIAELAALIRTHAAES